ncbi:MAG TPA: glycosyltransferase [Thermoanaerobaculia bacterium]
MEHARSTVRPGERIRLLWLIDSLNVGGAESLILPFARALDPRRFALTVCSLTTINGNQLKASIEDAGLKTVNLEARSLRDFRAFRRLLGMLRTESFDLIHAHLTYASIWGALAGRLARVPTVASLHVAPPGSGSDGLRDRLMRFALSRWAARTIAVSDSLRTQYLAAGGLDERRVVTIHNGIETGPFNRPRIECRARIKEEFGIPQDVLLLVCVSVLRPGKGIDVLLQAATLMPESHILIVGDGAMRAEWERLAVALGLADRVRFAGHRSDISQWLAGGDILVHPSLADAFPTVLLEAMAAGLPVVASHVGGIPEIVVHGRTGLLVPPGNPDALAAAVRSLGTGPPASREMGTEGRRIVDEQFSTDAWTARIEALYGEVVVERKLPRAAAE